MSQEVGRRITMKRTNNNRILQVLVEDLYKQAVATKSKLEPMLRDAVHSIAKYPLELKSGSDCRPLKGFEPILCKYIDKTLRSYFYHVAVAKSVETQITTSSNSGDKQTNPNDENLDRQSTKAQCGCSETASIVSSVSNSIFDIEPPVSNNQTSRNENYKPALKSGGYGLLLGLIDISQPNMNQPCLTKAELVQKAQLYSDESFLKRKPGSYHTAWANMSRLIKKGLVRISNLCNEFTYQLTEEGTIIARELLRDDIKALQTQAIPYNPMHRDGNVITPQAMPFEPIEINSDVIRLPTIPCNPIERNADVINKAIPSSSLEVNAVNRKHQACNYDIILLIDKNETSGVSKKNDPTVAEFNKYSGLYLEYRSLAIGDYIWIARHKVNKDQEYVLPYIVERKRMDDLAASIKDGRFHEQKFRLRKCGLKNVIYLVENYGNNKHVGLPIQTLMQALANTRVQDDFKVHFTDSLANTARFLAMLTKRLFFKYRHMIRNSCKIDPYDEHSMLFKIFNRSSVKTRSLTVTETFIKLLLQLKGVSVEKALAITAKYPTPKSLIIAYKKCDRKAGECLLANLKYNEISRNVGPVVSKAIYQLFSKTSD